MTTKLFCLSNVFGPDYLSAHRQVAGGYRAVFQGFQNRFHSHDQRHQRLLAVEQLLMKRSPAAIGVPAASLGLALIISFLVLGVRVAARTPAPTPRPGLVTITQPLIAAGLGVLSFSAPEVGVTLSALILIMLAPWAAQLTTLAFSLLRAAASTFHDLGRPRPKWETGVGGLPRALRRALEDHLGRPLDAVRSARLTLARFGSRWPFYRGRLILASEAPPLFAHRSRLRPHILELGPGHGSASNDFLIDILEVEASTPYALCVGPEAPWGAAILAALTGEEGIGQAETPGGDTGQKHM